MATKFSEITAADMRSAMIDSQLRTNDVIDAAVVGAMAAVPREAHVPAHLASVAYTDRAIALGHGRALNAPLVTGRMLVAAAIRPGQRVLLIGSATGYTAAVLARLGAEVHAVEEQAELMAMAQAATSRRKYPLGRRTAERRGARRCAVRPHHRRRRDRNAA